MFLSNDVLVEIFYLQSFSLVGFLIEGCGDGVFTSFCRQLRDGRTVGEALRYTYNINRDYLHEFENKWRKYIEVGDDE